MNESFEKIKSALADATTAENAEKIAELGKMISGIESEFQKAKDEAKAAKNALVRGVMQSPVRESPKSDESDNPEHLAAPPSIDEAIEMGLKEIFDARKNK